MIFLFGYLGLIYLSFFYFLKTGQIIFKSFDFLDNLKNISAKWLKNPEQRRAHLLAFALNPLVFCTEILFLVTVFRLNSVLFLALAFVLFLVLHFLESWSFKSANEKWKAFQGLFFYFSLVILAFELMSRFQFLFKSLEEYSDLALLLADGSFQSVVCLFGFSFLVTMTFKLRNWSWILSILFLQSFQVSMNGAVSLLVGEWSAFLFLAWFQLRMKTSDKSVLKKLRQGVLIQLLGLGLGFIGYAFAKGSIDLIFTSFEGLQPMDKYLVYFLFVFIPMWFAGMVWGHFSVRQKSNIKT